MRIKGLILACLLIVTGSMVVGQDQPPRFQDAMAKMKAERVSFLTDKLQLTVDEAEKFWPLYNEYLAKREEMMWGKREKMHRNFDPSQISDEDMGKMLNELLDQEVKLAQLKKDYFEKMKTVLPIRKVLTLHRVEQEFMNHMLNKLREGRAPGGGRPSDKDEIRSPLD